MTDPKEQEHKLTERNIPGMNRHERFVQVQHAENTGATLKRILTYFAREKSMVCFMLTTVIFGILCGILAPGLQSNAIDILASSRSGSFSLTLTFMLTVYLLYSGSQLLQNLLSARLSQRIVKGMREELFEKIVDLPIRYLDTHSHGDVMSRMTNDTENISTTVSQSLPSLFSGILTILGTVMIMMWYCWQLALLSCGTVILTLLATRILSGQIRSFSRKRQMLLGQLNGTVEEMISGYPTVAAYNHQDITTENFFQTADSLTKAGIKTDIFSGVMGPVMNCIGNIGFVIIAAFGGYFSIHGLISVGVISAFIVYAKQFSRPINEIAQVYGQLQTAIAEQGSHGELLEKKGKYYELYMTQYAGFATLIGNSQDYSLYEPAAPLEPKCCCGGSHCSSAQGGRSDTQAQYTKYIEAAGPSRQRLTRP